MISRRAFLRSATVASTSVAAGFLAHDLRSESSYTGTPLLERINVSIETLPPSFDGYRIGFLTDPHLGMWVPQSWIVAALETLRESKPDILVLGGDYIFVSDNPIWKISGAIRNWDYVDLSRRETAAKAFHDFARIISNFSFPDGIIGVTGNHDNWNSPKIFHDVMKQFSNIRILLNEEIFIARNGERIGLFGVDDYLTGFPTLPPRRIRAPLPVTRILVSHNPDYVALLANEDPSLFDLALCGHTHGGQVCLPGITGLVVPIQNPAFLAGLAQTGESVVYTSRGLGVVGLPFRFHCPPELTIIELRKS